ncbi:TRAP transporter small permease [Ruania zhangjianzhongii]|uniref:TRAP transporter small permease n=1 Tax=Ruania zhangjianzhongii TaxID=2603206 RepID=UPI00143D96AE|nr:TRAP transporter small permease [Ruania zhangjianzhongii]
MDVLAKAESILCALLLAVVLGTAVVQVIMRFVLHEPLAVSDEFARFAMIWLGFIGAALTQARDQHIAVLVIRGTGSRLRQQIMDGLANVVALVLGVWVLFLGKETLERSANVTSASLEIPMSVVYLSVVVGFGLIAVHALRNLANLAFHGQVDPEREDGSLAERQQLS